MQSSDSPITYQDLLAAMIPVFVATGLWVILAWRTPTSTYHFAPLIAGFVGPYVLKARSGRRELRTAASVAAACVAIVAAAIIALAAGDRLQGPTFWSDDGAAGEAILFALIGGLLGISTLRSASKSAPA